MSELNDAAKQDLEKLKTELWGEDYQSLDTAKKENKTREFPGTTIPADLELKLQRDREDAEKRREELKAATEKKATSVETETNISPQEQSSY